ncbi:MAG TPA: VOC family protein [Patescibacteria group bacterium]|nr:VOC family protein [Patescibacteria group bacterium]
MKLSDKHISVCLWSENYEKLAKWYEEVLGFKVNRRLNLPDDTGVDFDFLPTYFYVGKHDKVKGTSKDPYRMMVGFNVESISKAYDELKDKDITWIAKPFAGPPGGFWCMTIADPEGNILQFFGDK